jgi:hypothetical protein
MKSFHQYLDEIFKKPNILQGLISKRARRAREVHDKRLSPDRKLGLQWKEKEAELNRKMGWDDRIESASVGKGSPWALARGFVGEKPKAPKKKKEKPPSIYDVGHYKTAKEMKQVDLFHIGAKSGYDSINHHDHYTQSNQRRAKNYEGRLNPHNATHETWIKRHKTKGHEDTRDEHYAQGRIDHITKQYTVNGSNDKMEEQARKHMDKHYPEYTEHHISN